MRQKVKSIQYRLVKCNYWTSKIYDEIKLLFLFSILLTAIFSHVGEEVGVSAGVLVGVVVIIVGVIGGACIIAR